MCGEATLRTIIVLVGPANLKEKGVPVRFPDSPWNEKQQKLVEAKPKVARATNQKRKKSIIWGSLPLCTTLC